MFILKMKKSFSLENESGKYKTEIPYEDPDLITLLSKNNVSLEGKTSNKYWRNVLIQILFWIFISVLIYFVFFRQFRSKAGGAFSFGRSKAKMVDPQSVKIKFSDVQGCDEAKHELQEVVSFLKNPSIYFELGAEIPRGVLLVGQPGTGKTMLAKAVASEAKVPFFSVSGSDFVEMFVGVGASRVRDLFENAKQQSPCILFIDEIDAVGRTRGSGYGGGHDEREQTLNQLLVEMDGFDKRNTVIVIAATNRSDVLDNALLRPGRFDRKVIVNLPDSTGREAILKVHAKKIKVNRNIDLNKIAKVTTGFTGADLANLLNESALYAAHNRRKKVEVEHIEYSREKIIMGSERKNVFMKEKEKRMTAYHEAGHALISMLLEHTDNLYKVSIIPRGQALGVTSFIPEDGVYSASKTKILQDIMVNFGGRAAEEITFNEISTGASNDMEKATHLARLMVCQYGMSKLGPINFGENNKERGYSPYGRNQKDDEYSEETAKKIDQEISDILMSCYNKTYDLLKSNLDRLKLFAEKLLDKEVMDVEEAYELLGMKAPVSLKI